MKLFSTLFLLVLLSVSIHAKDNWITVRSQNFFLVGNASEKEIRQVGTKLEQFREVFRQLFPAAKFTSGKPTNVVVFKNDSAYRPFKPKRADGKPNDGIAGYFQPGPDVNYITVAAGGDKEDTYGTIFHEYVHFMVDSTFGDADVPPWFNEGLAEYYQTFKIEEDQKVSLGLIQEIHLSLLSQNKLIPLSTFFEIDNYSLHQNGNHSRSIFYAQAWALMHYLVQGVSGQDKEGLGNFLQFLSTGIKPEEAFRKAFKRDYATMEKELRKYIAQSSFRITVATFQNKLVFDSKMQTSTLSEAEANAYLGDLLYHTHEFTDAETYLLKSVAADPAQPLANTALGLVRMRQRKFDEAKKYLEKAIASNQLNAHAHYNYAYIISREAMDEFGMVREYPAASAKLMRDSLEKAIALNPGFIDSYRLLGFVNMVNGEDLEKTEVLLSKALRITPGDRETQFILAQLFARRDKFAEAKALAERIYKTTDEADLRVRAEQLIKQIEMRETNKAARDEYEEQRKEREQNGPILRREDKNNRISAEEKKKFHEDNMNLSINNSLPVPGDGMRRVLGKIQKIECIKGVVHYTVVAGAETLRLRSTGFSKLELVAVAEGLSDLTFGCSSNVAQLLSLVTFKTFPDAATKTAGEVFEIRFMPDYFRIMTADEIKAARPVYVEEYDENAEKEREAQEADILNRQAENEKRQRESMIEGIKKQLRAPQAGETRVLGSLEKIECSGKSATYHIVTGGQKLKLKSSSPESVEFRAFSNDASGLQLGCGMTLPPINTIITYRAKGKDLEAVAFEFVPRSITLD